MRFEVFAAAGSSLSLEGLETLPAPSQLVLTRITAQELALKLKSGQCGPLKPCCYSPASHTIKILTVS